MVHETQPYGFAARLSIGLAGLLFGAVVIGLFLVDARLRYDAAIDAAHTDTRNYAKILAEQTALTFGGIDIALREAESIRLNDTRGAYTTPDAVHRALRHVAQTSPALVAIGWTDAQGNLQQHSYDSAPPRTNVGEMSHFVAQRDRSDAGLYVAPPYLSATSNRWLSAASRRLNNPDGSFAGIVTAPIDQSYFNKFYRSVDLGSEGSIMLLHREGRVLAREPVVAEAIGKSLKDSPILSERLPRAEAGTFESPSPVDGLSRIVSYQAVAGLPLVVLVTQSRAEVLAPWYSVVGAFAPIVALIVAGVAFGTWLLLRQTRSLAAQTHALADTAASLSRTNLRFDAAISNMAQGLCMFDADKRLLMSNDRFCEIYGLPKELMKRGQTVGTLIHEMAARGFIPDDSSIEEFEQFAAERRRQTLINDAGRVISLSRTPIPGGGWIAIHEDITEQRAAERLLAASATEIKRANELFSVAINNMSQGVCLFDAEQRVVVANTRYAELYHLDPEQVRAGTTLQQILAYRQQRGTNFAVAPDTYRSVNVRKLQEVQELADGRIVSIVRRMVSDGGWLTTHEDITERTQNERRIAYLAQHDILTGLANRALFTEKLDEASKRQKRHGAGFTVLMLDLDKFKAVNDTLGHAAGDELLRQVAARLRGSLRETDVLARLGGDEFAIIQEGETDQQHAAVTVATRIIDLISQPFDLDGHRADIGTSIGIAFAPDHGSEPDELLKRADLALYATKSAGRNDFRIFHPDMGKRQQERAA